MSDQVAVPVSDAAGNCCIFRILNKEPVPALHYYNRRREIRKYQKKDPDSGSIICRVFEEGRHQGIETGIEQGIEMNQLDNIRNLTQDLMISARQVMELIVISISDQEKSTAII